MNGTEQVWSIYSIINAFLDENPCWEQHNCFQLCGWFCSNFRSVPRQVLHKSLLKCCLPLGIKGTCELCNCLPAMQWGSTLLDTDMGTPLYLWAPINVDANSWHVSLLAVCWRGGAGKVLLLEVLSPVCPNYSFCRAGVSGMPCFKVMCLRTVWLGACSDLLNFTLCVCIHAFICRSMLLVFFLFVFPCIHLFCLPFSFTPSAQ